MKKVYILMICLISFSSIWAQQPDLIVQNFTVTPSSGPSPGTVSITFKIKNQGSISTVSQGGFDIIVYLSDNTTISGSDTELWNYWESGSIGAGNFKEYSASNIAIPGSLNNAQTYYIGAYVDKNQFISESNESNNTGYDDYTIASTLKPDLTVGNVSVNPTSGPSPSSVNVTFKVYNQGTASTQSQGGFDIKLYWSTNNTITTSDTELWTYWESGYINAGNFKEYTVNNVSIPSGQSTGTYYIGAYADVNSFISEISDDNNTGYTSFTVSSQPSDPYEQPSNNTRSQAYQISFSGSPPTWYSGVGPTIDPSTDQDWFKFSASTGDSLIIFCDVTSDLDPKIVLYLGDTYKDSRDYSASGGDETLAYNVLMSGTYYVGVGYWTNISKVSSPLANTGSYNLTIIKQSTLKPDLTVGNVSVNPTSGPSPSSVNVTFKVYNQGTASTQSQGGFDIKLYWSTNNTITTSDTELWTYWESGYINAGNFKEYTVNNVSIPSGQSTGTYYIGAYADVNSFISEISDDNNTGYTSFTVSSQPSDPYEQPSNNTRSQAYQISFSGSPPTWYSGVGPTIDPSTDQDWFKFSGSTLKQININCNVTSSLDAKIALYIGNIELSSCDNFGSGGDETLLYNVPSGLNGTYYIGIAYYGTTLKTEDPNANTGSYQLSVSLPQNTDIEQQELSKLPTNIILEQNYPNPFNNFTKVSFGLPTSEELTLSILNVKGELVENLFFGNMDAGYHEITWNTSSVSSGIYFIKLATKEIVLIKQCLHIK